MDAKNRLDTLIKKSRVHFYKPTQIAEILYRNRTTGFSVDRLDDYRSASKHWRDEVSRVLVGSVCTSSSRFQDNLFDANAIPPDTVAELAAINRDHEGLVEAYVYRAMLTKMNDLGVIHQYLNAATAEDFSLKRLIGLFSSNQGLRRSMDKVYEIVTYALFNTVIDAVGATITVSLDHTAAVENADFEGFTDKLFGIAAEGTKTVKAHVYRVGATNANDGGLDLWSNFGPAIQVKHFKVHPDQLQAIVAAIKADALIVVCTEVDAGLLRTELERTPGASKLQSVVTYRDLEAWYAAAMSEAYRATAGAALLRTLIEEFEYEFPANGALPVFLQERGYDTVLLDDEWDVERLGLAQDEPATL